MHMLHGLMEWVRLGMRQRRESVQRQESVERREKRESTVSEAAGRLLGLFGGCALIGMGIVFLVSTNWGPAAWDVFHLAVAERAGWTLGRTSITVGLVIIGITLLLGGAWTVRWGTLVNTFVIGFSVDFFMRLGLPQVSALGLRLLYVAVGTFLMALGSVLYTRAGYGAGARDGLMLVLSQKLPFTVGRIRLATEIVVCLTGLLLGGPFGPGTVLITCGAGPTADLIYRVLGRGYLPETVRIPERAA